ncbi:MAG: hypothetical protein AAF298_18955 [Cyanobacteria bacterium P01_A01_bin.40]
MNTCPYCSYTLLRHLRTHQRCWYCRLETSESLILAQNKTGLHKSLLIGRQNSALVAADCSI